MLLGHPGRVKLRRFRRRDQNGQRSYDLPVSFIPGPLRMTRRAGVATMLAALREPYSKVEQRLGIPRAKVRRLMAAYLGAFADAYRPVASRRIALDGVHPVGQTYTVIADAEAKAVIDLLPRHDEETLVQWFANVAGRDRIEAVAIDLSEMERRALRRISPLAAGEGQGSVAVVADKRHVLALILRSMARYRAELGISQQREYFAGRRRRVDTLKALIEMPGRRLAPHRAAWLREQFDALPCGQLLQAAYDVKEGFLPLYDCRTRSEAESWFVGWRNSIPPRVVHVYRPCVDIIGQRWRPEVFAFFDGHPITTAYVEAINRQIKQRIADARGNLPFPLLRARVLFAYGREETRRLMETLAFQLADDLAQNRGCPGLSDGGS